MNEQKIVDLSPSIVEVEDIRVTLTYDFDNETDADNFEKKAREVLADFTELSIDTLPGDPEEEPWFIVNIEMNYHDKSIEDFKSALALLDS